MLLRTVWFSLLLLVAGGLMAQAPKRIAIRAGKLIDGKIDTPLVNALITVEGGKILSVTPGGVPPAGAEVIDLSKSTVLPGLIDTHTHIFLQGDITSADYDEQLLKQSIPYRAILAARNARVALDHGFTTMRDLETEGAMYADVDVKMAINRGEVPGSRMIVSTRAMAPTGMYPLLGYSWGRRFHRTRRRLHGRVAGPGQAARRLLGADRDGRSLCCARTRRRVATAGGSRARRLRRGIEEGRQDRVRHGRRRLRLEEGPPVARVSVLRRLRHDADPGHPNRHHCRRRAAGYERLVGQHRSRQSGRYHRRRRRSAGGHHGTGTCEIRDERRCRLRPMTENLPRIMPMTQIVRVVRLIR